VVLPLPLRRNRVRKQESKRKIHNAETFYLFLLILITVIPVFSQNASQTFTTKERDQFSIELKQDKETVMLGEPTFLLLDLKNLSEQRWSMRITELSLINGKMATATSFRFVGPNGIALPKPYVSLRRLWPYHYNAHFPQRQFGQKNSIIELGEYSGERNLHLKSSDHILCCPQFDRLLDTFPSRSHDHNHSNSVRLHQSGWSNRVSRKNPARWRKSDRRPGECGGGGTENVGHYEWWNGDPISGSGA